MENTTLAFTKRELEVLTQALSEYRASCRRAVGVAAAKKRAADNLGFTLPSSLLGYALDQYSDACKLLDAILDARGLTRAQV